MGGSVPTVSHLRVLRLLADIMIEKIISKQNILIQASTMGKANTSGFPLRLNEPSAEQKTKQHMRESAVHTLRIEQINLSEEDLASVHLRKELGEHLRLAGPRYCRRNIRSRTFEKDTLQPADQNIIARDTEWRLLGPFRLFGFRNPGRSSRTFPDRGIAASASCIGPCQTMVA